MPSSFSITRVFFITAATFGALSLWGYTTKRDISGWGSFLFMGLIGIVIALSIFAIIPPSTTLKLAKDLNGGATLVYQVEINSGGQSGQIVVGGLTGSNVEPDAS